MSARYPLPERPGQEGGFLVATPKGFRVDTPKSRPLNATQNGDELTWLWPERIAKRRVTLIEGPADSGKSFVALTVAAIASSGAAWPDVSRDAAAAEPEEPADRSSRKPFVLLLTNNNDDDVVGERLYHAGGDSERCHRFLHMDVSQVPRHDSFDDWSASWSERQPTDPRRDIILPHDVPAIEYLLDELGQFGHLVVVIDSLLDYCPELHLVDKAIARLNQVAALTGAAIIATLPASVRREGEGQLRVQPRAADDSARCVWCLEPDPDDRELRWLVPTRMSFCQQTAAPLAFRIEEGAVVWEQRQRAELTEAGHWLRWVLAAGELAARDLFRLAREHGFSRKSLYRARRQAGATVRRVGFGPESASVWSLGTPLLEGSAVRICMAKYEESAENHPISAGKYEGKYGDKYGESMEDARPEIALDVSVPPAGCRPGGGASAGWQPRRETARVD